MQDHKPVWFKEPLLPAQQPSTCANNDTPSFISVDILGERKWCCGQREVGNESSSPDSQRRAWDPGGKEGELVIFCLPGDLLGGNLIRQSKNQRFKPNLDCSASRLLLYRDHKMLSRALPTQEVTKPSDFTCDVKAEFMLSNYPQNSQTLLGRGKPQCKG